MTAATDNVLLVLRDTLRDKMVEINDHLASGGCKDYAEYRYFCGCLRGLGEAERELLDMNQRIEEA